MNYSKYKLLRDMHLVYSRNVHVFDEGKHLHFEPRDYHLGMAKLYSMKMASCPRT